MLKIEKKQTKAPLIASKGKGAAKAVAAPKKAKKPASKKGG